MSRSSPTAEKTRGRVSATKARVDCASSMARRVVELGRVAQVLARLVEERAHLAEPAHHRAQPLGEGIELARQQLVDARARQRHVADRVVLRGRSSVISNSARRAWRSSSAWSSRCVASSAVAGMASARSITCCRRAASRARAAALVSSSLSSAAWSAEPGGVHRRGGGAVGAVLPDQLVEEGVGIGGRGGVGGAGGGGRRRRRGGTAIATAGGTGGRRDDEQGAAEQGRGPRRSARRSCEALGGACRRRPVTAERPIEPLGRRRNVAPGRVGAGRAGNLPASPASNVSSRSDAVRLVYRAAPALLHYRRDGAEPAAPKESCCSTSG